MARSTIVLMAFAAFSSTPLHAEIVLETTELALEPGFIQYTVSAVEAGGEELNAISGLELTGLLHQVHTISTLGSHETPTVDRPGYFLFGAGNEIYDTHFLPPLPYAFKSSAVVEPRGDTSTTGTLTNLPTFDLGFGLSQTTGYSHRLAMDPLDGTIVLTQASPRIDLVQVVLREHTQALLDVRIDGPGVTQVFEDFPIGELDPDYPVLVGAPGPREGPIDLTDAFLAGDDSGIDIVLSNASGDFANLQAVSAEVANDALGLFEATVVGNRVNVRLNTQGINLATLAPGWRTARLTVNADGDPNTSLVYGLRARIPEPTTALLSVVALVFAAARPEVTGRVRH
ncbi:MAG: hypothetical protein AAGJ46_19745 [Planctomycetota bacterium]